MRDLLVERWGPTVARTGRSTGGGWARSSSSARSSSPGWESALHPLVGERIGAWREALPEGTPLAVVEVPLLFETGLDAYFDATIAIVADDATRAERAGERGTDALEGRAARQLSQAEKAARATYVVRNDGTVDELEGALAELIATLAPRGEQPA